MNAWRWYWAAWLLLGFLVPEVIALTRRSGNDTLSEAVWYWCKVTPGDPLKQWTAVHILVLFFFVWLFVHIVLGYWR